MKYPVCFFFLFSLRLHFQFIARDQSQNFIKQKIIQNTFRVDFNSGKKTFWYEIPCMSIFFFSVSDSNSLRVIKIKNSSCKKKDSKYIQSGILIVEKRHFDMKYPVCSFSSFQSQTPFPIHCAWSKPLGKLFLRPSAMLTQSSMSWPRMDSWAFLDGALKPGELAFFDLC